MNYQDLRNLQESYLEMYEARDGYGDDSKFNKPDDKIKKPGTEVPAPKKGGYGRISRSIPYGIGAHANRTASRVTTIVGNDPGAPRSEKMAKDDKKTSARKLTKKGGKWTVGEDFDLYDLVMFHLLDEGFVETEESAIAIMANMSEEWVDSIIDEYLEEDFDEISEDAASFSRRQENKKKMFAMNKKRAPKHGPTQTIPGKKTVRKKPEGGWEVGRHPDRTMPHPRTATARQKRGMVPLGMTPDQQFGSHKSLPKHSTAKVSTMDFKAGKIGSKTIKGSERGVKKVKGAKTSQPETKVQAAIRRKKEGPQPDPMDALRGGQSRGI